MKPFHLYLASTSPRRRELLAQLGVQFEGLPVDVEEVPESGEPAEEYVKRVSLDKALAGWTHPDRVLDRPVLGSDTEVVLDGKVFGKPESREHAFEMLQRLSGRRHEVLSAVAVIQGDRQKVVLNRNQVFFREISSDEILAYWRTGEPQGKAGGYAIQGVGAIFIHHLEGSFSGVMGLPLYETAELLAEFGVEIL
jgi:septum formation protein